MDSTNPIPAPDNMSLLEGSDLIRVLGFVYPIDSIYMTVNNTNPNYIFGFGTWVAWGTGRVPVGVDTAQTEFNTVEKTGGHKLLQAHDHGANLYFVGNGNAVQFASAQGGIVTGATTSARTQTVGGGDSQNLQPYITCYMWKRIL